MNRFILAGATVVAIVFIWLLVARLKSAPNQKATALSAVSVEREVAKETGVATAEPHSPATSRATTNPRPIAAVSTPTQTTSLVPDEAALFRQALDTTISSRASFEQKQAAWLRLRQSEKLDAAIGELEEICRNHPTTANYPAALAQAYLQKCATTQDVREQGILAMKADQVFDTALVLDPTHWEAGFFKAMSLSYWPAEMNRGAEVIQRFTTLIEQQEAGAPQPHFAQSYVWLGEQYRKTGRADFAQQVWQRGAALYPADLALQSKLTPP